MLKWSDLIASGVAYINPLNEQLACSNGFDVAFAKLLWPLVIYRSSETFCLP